MTKDDKQHVRELKNIARRDGWSPQRTKSMLGILKNTPAENRAELIKALQTREWDFLEQDAINELCRGRILELPGRYNVSYYTVPDTELYIRHYAAEGGWWEYPEVRRYNVKL